MWNLRSWVMGGNQETGGGGQAPAAEGEKKNLTAEDIFEPHILPQYDPEAVKILVRAFNAGLPLLHEVPLEDRRANPAKYRPPWAKDPAELERVETGREVDSEDGYRVPIAGRSPATVLRSRHDLPEKGFIFGR